MNNKSLEKNKKWLIIMIGVCIFLLAGVKKTQADEKKLPSDIEYSELNEKIEEYFSEHEKTAAGFAYSVFDNQGNIAMGYLGYADKENSVLVDKETVFEWGSGSKMLVWVSVMQLAEQGKIDLDADIKEYLPEGFLSNLSYDIPVTMIHLMNHTAGFQDEPADMSILEDGYLSTLSEAISAHKPVQIYKPGTASAYSNWSTSLAAYIVERQTGMQFTDYVHNNIFAPLGMEKCAFSSNLSDNQWVKDRRDELHCYDSNGNYIENSKYYCPLYPAGGCVSTFEEYEKFAKAMLGRSELLMKDETWEQFFTPSDYFGETDMAKNCHGLWYVYFKVPTVGHIGKTSGCSSYILLDMENQIGAALICNQGSETVLTEEMMSLIFGDYKTSEYYAGDKLPEGIFRCAKTVDEGPFRFTSLMGGLSKDLSKEYWTLTAGEEQNILEIGYMDYVEISPFRVFIEYVLLFLYAICMIILIIMLPVRLVGMIIKKTSGKETDKYALRFWSVAATALIVAVPVLNLMMLQSTAMPSTSYVWISQVICGIMVALAVLIVYGLIKNIRTKLPFKWKVYNFFAIVASVISVVNILYWDLYMFWKI